MNKNNKLEIDETFSLAVKNHLENKTDIAEDLYNQVLKIDPYHTNALNNLGVIYRNSGKTEKAIECYEKAVEINSNYADAHFNLGNVFKDLKELQKAKNCYEKAIEINPSYVEANNNLGTVFSNLGEAQKAKNCYEKTIKINPNFAYAHYNLGAIFKNLGETEKAKNCYEKAIEINPNYADAYFNLGITLTHLKKLQEAKNCYEKAIEINPNYVDALNNLGSLFNDLGQYSKALNCYEKIIEINPNFEKTYNNQGNTYKELGEEQKAKDCYKKAIEINPNYSIAHFGLAVLLDELGEKNKAIECYKKAIEADPNYTKAHNQLLKSLYNVNNQSVLFKKLESITKEGKMNAVIGSIFSRAEIKYGVKKNNPFCNDPLDYVLKTDLTKKYDFKDVIVKHVNNILKSDSISNKAQKLITNGYQTAGNLFINENFDTNEIQKIIRIEIEKYRLHFKDSKEGFIKNWPTNYTLYGWLINLKKGGKLSAHMHDLGWLSGSIYVNVPQKSEADSGNLVVCISDQIDEVKDKNVKNIDVVTGSLCLFPSSLLHYTIPFKSEESRIVLAFDVVRK